MVAAARVELNQDSENMALSFKSYQTFRSIGGLSVNTST